MLNSLDKIAEAAVALEKAGVVSVAAAHDFAVLEAVVIAKRAGLVTPILVGDIKKISDILRELNENPADYEIVPAEDDIACAKKAVALVTEGRADFLMKGILNTADLMRAVLAKEANLRTNSLLSHIMLFESPNYPRMLLMSDGGMNTFPDLDKKVQILENAATVLKKLGYDHINASCVCAAELLNPKVQSMVDADTIAHMDRWKKEYNMDVIGPISVDLALSPEACRHKHFDRPGAGEADILLVTNYEMGNALYKSALIFAGCRAAGLIMGARVPIILVSRSDSAESKLASIALGAIISKS